MRGSVAKRCQCRDSDGRRVKNCRKAHGSWAFTIDVGTDAETGKRKQIVRSRFRTQADAQEGMTRELAALNAGLWNDDRNMSVGAWLDQWLGEIQVRIEVNTYRSYAQHCRDFFVPLLGHIKLRDLRRGHVEGMFRSLAAPRVDEARGHGNAGRFVEQRSPRTLDSYRRTLRAALNTAKRRGLVAANVAEGRIDALPRARAAELEWWEPVETARFLEFVAADPYCALYEVAAYTGMRRSELLGLRWADVDLDQMGVTVRQVLISTPGTRPCHVCAQAHQGRYLKQSTKSEAGTRWVPLVRPARDALLAHREAQADLRVAYGDDYADHDLVFPLLDGTPTRPEAVTRRFQQLTDIVPPATPDGRRLPHIRLHDLRHGAASLLLAGGVPLELVAMILGHAPEVTRQIYAHVLKGPTRDLVETASDLLTRHRTSIS